MGKPEVEAEHSNTNGEGVKALVCVQGVCKYKAGRSALQVTKPGVEAETATSFERV